MAIYSFAGVTVKMNPKYETLISRSAPYMISESDSSDYDIQISLPDELYDEVKNNCKEPSCCNDLSCASIEYMFSATEFYRKLLSFGGMMIHASAVAADGKAFLFTAPPGTGKSTHTAGWLSALGDRAVIINDDKPAVRFIGETAYAMGTPFSGSSPLNKNISVPIGGICILCRGNINHIERISQSQAFPILYSQTINTLSHNDCVRMLDILTKITDTVPLYRLECTIGPQAVKCSYEAMTGKKLMDI